MKQGNLFDTFNRIQKAKSEQKEIKAMYKDALENNKEYQKSFEDYKKARDEKKKIEQEIKEEFRSEFDKLEILKNEIMTDSELLSDMVISKVAKGDKIELTDEFENRLEPVFKVKFIKQK